MLTTNNWTILAMQHNVDSEILQSATTARRTLNAALRDYVATAAEHGHDSAEAVIAKLRWQKLKTNIDLAMLRSIDADR